MDPLSASASISSVIMNLVVFLQERRGRKEAQDQASMREYTEWLRQQEHTEIIALLESNHQFSQAIHRLLIIGRDEILERFDRLEAMLSLILGSTAEWGELVQSINPNAGLSQQAIEILKWLDASGGTQFFTVQPMGWHLVLKMQDGNYSAFEASEQRFLENDLMTLLELGLLRINQRGHYIFTRSMKHLLRQLPVPDEKNAQPTA